MKRPAALGLALIAPGAAAAPAAPGDVCVRMAADLEQIRQPRQQALERGDDAWRTVLPFAVITPALTMTEFRASSRRRGLRDRGNEIAQHLGFRPFPVSSRRYPLTTSGVGACLHPLVTFEWVASLHVERLA